MTSPLPLRLTWLPSRRDSHYAMGPTASQVDCSVCSVSTEDAKRSGLQIIRRVKPHPFVLSPTTSVPPKPFYLDASF